jgi:hypothetical protein
MTPDERRTLIDRYREGYDVVAAALDGATADDLGRRPSPDEWSAREVVHHLADSEMTSAIRLRKLLVEDEPTIEGYDEGEFARRLFYDRPLDGSLAAFKGARLASVGILERLDETQWPRRGTHSESGPYGVETWLEIYAEHAHDHAQQIRRALRR